MVHLTCAYEFNAVHRMWNASMTDTENHETFGKCANPAGHGHRYRLEITFGRAVTADDPFVVPRRDLDRLVECVLAPRLENADLNTAFGASFISSGERIAQAVWDLVARQFETGARLVAVRVNETRKNSFVYRGSQPEGDTE